MWEVLRRPLYRGEIIWNRSRKRDVWGQKHQRAREESEWLRIPAPGLRIVPEDLWRAAHERLAGARADYIKATGGRLWGRAVNGTATVKYLFAGLSQCALCGSGLLVHSRAHGAARAYFYVCLSYWNKGTSICRNGQVLPMPLINGEVLTAFREDPLDPVVMDRAFLKLRARLTMATDRPRHTAQALQAELHRVTTALGRLTTALAQGGDLPCILEEIRQQEALRRAALTELEALADKDRVAQPDVDVVLPELRRRVRQWQQVLSEETAEARQMLRTLMKTRIVFTPDLDAPKVTFEARGHYEQLFAGLINLPVSIGVSVPNGIRTRVLALKVKKKRTRPISD